MDYYNVMGEPDDNDPLDISIPDSEGMCAVDRFGISSYRFLNPLKAMKINIRSLQNPKFSNIRYYWDGDTFEKIMNLLHDFWDLFPTKFSKMKGIFKYLGEMNIPVMHDENLLSSDHTDCISSTNKKSRKSWNEWWM